MKKLLTWCCASLMALLMAACGGEDSGAPSQPDQGGGAGTPSIVSLQVTPTQGHIPVGFELQFIAQATLSDGTVKDVTTDARLSWSSSDAAIAAIDVKGLAKGIVPGTVTITASGMAADGKAVTATAQLNVTDAVVTSLQVTPSTATIAAGLEQVFIATAILSDGRALDVTTFTGLSWSSSAPAITTIDNADRKGVATGLAAGATTITASGTANGTPFSATAQLTVTDAVVTSLQVTPTTEDVPVGLQQQFTAMALLSDGTSQPVTDDAAISWSSSDPTIATISSGGASGNGLATGEATGTVTITASGSVNGTPFSATAQLTVTDAVVTSLQVIPTTASTAVGSTQQFTATATFSDGSSLDVTNDASLTWYSDNTTVATISNADGNRGEAMGLSEGAALITASMAGLNSNAVALSVTPATAIIIEPIQKQLASLQLSPSEFAFWNSTSINSPEGQIALKELTALVYEQFQDEFDFITVVMNNEDIPFRMPSGEYAHVKNDVAGIGLSMFDDTTDFHSDGKLQGIWFLYKKGYLSDSLYGPILHEMCHRWANWVVPSSYGGHWGAELGITGQLNSVSANYADIELYLMGLMDRSEMTDPASINAYNLIPVDQQTRVPSAASSQKEFRVLLLVLSDRPLTVTEIRDYNDGATLLTRTDDPSQGTNFHRMTKGRGTMVIEGLDALEKPID